MVQVAGYGLINNVVGPIRGGFPDGIIRLFHVGGAGAVVIFKELYGVDHVLLVIALIIQAAEKIN